MLIHSISKEEQQFKIAQKKPLFVNKRAFLFQKRIVAARFVENNGLQNLGIKFPYSTNNAKNQLKANPSFQQIGSLIGSKTEDPLRSMPNSYYKIGNAAVNQVISECWILRSQHLVCMSRMPTV